jgi:hypothetical protein
MEAIRTLALYRPGASAILLFPVGTYCLIFQYDSGAVHDARASFRGLTRLATAEKAGVVAAPELNAELIGKSLHVVTISDHPTSSVRFVNPTG